MRLICNFPPFGDKQVPFSQAKNGTNRWISVGLPASLSLALPAAVSIKQVQLVFDTGMHRRLAYSVSYVNNNPAGVGWGPQPETVRDYVIEGEVDGKWAVLCTATSTLLSPFGCGWVC